MTVLSTRLTFNTWAALAGAVLLCFAQGCRDRGDEAGASGDNVATNEVTQSNVATLSQIIGEAIEASHLGDNNVMPPLPTAEEAATNPIAALRLQIHENSLELDKAFKRKYDFEERLCLEDTEIKALFESIEAQRQRYNELVADRLSGTLVLGNISKLTHRRRDLFAQLRKLQETP